MDPKPLPDRIRPLEGAGMLNLYGNMGATPKRDRFIGPVFVLAAIAIAAVMVLI